MRLVQFPSPTTDDAMTILVWLALAVVGSNEIAHGQLLFVFFLLYPQIGHCFILEYMKLLFPQRGHSFILDLGCPCDRACDILFSPCNLDIDIC